MLFKMVELPSGIGKKRGFEIEEIVLLSHGALHHDTIVTIDRKVVEN